MYGSHVETNNDIMKQWDDTIMKINNKQRHYKFNKRKLLLLEGRLAYIMKINQKQIKAHTLHELINSKITNLTFAIHYCIGIVFMHTNILN